MKRLIVFCLPVFAAFAAPKTPTEETPETWYQQGRQAILDAKARKPNNRKAKNVILFVADGMGISTVTAARVDVA